MSPSTPIWLPVLWASASGLLAPPAQVMVAAPEVTSARPTLEVSSWIGLGGGGRLTGQEPRGTFDSRVGGDVTLPVALDGDLRVGPFAEARSETFGSIGVVAGLQLFVGAVPRPLRIFYYSGEGTLVVRTGAGWSWYRDLPEATSAPLVSVTVAYGYRCPFSLREPAEEMADEPGRRKTLRYMIGVRLWANATVATVERGIWQVSGGIEFEPVGSFRYLFGLY